MTLFETFLRLITAALLSGLIGLEREIHGCAAGLRTHILVCIGSTLFMLTSIDVGLVYSHVGAVDPSRIAAGVVSGIGFLGAGAIIRYGTSIRGLTTAASIWAVSAIGLAVGAGMYKESVVTTLVALAVLILSRLEERMLLKGPGKKLCVTIQKDSSTGIDELKQIIDAYAGKVLKITSTSAQADGMKKIVLNVIISRIYRKDVTSDLASLPGIENVCWK